jgi:hypothetical protein
MSIYGRALNWLDVGWSRHLTLTRTSSQRPARAPSLAAETAASITIPNSSHASIVVILRGEVGVVGYNQPSRYYSGQNAAP